MTNIKDLLSRVDRLRALLLDPHPNLAEWRLGFNAASESLLHFYDDVYLDPTASRHIPGCCLPEIRLARDETSEADAKNGYGSSSANCRETICPDCGSPDPTVHYIPQDTHTLCENLWHRPMAG